MEVIALGNTCPLLVVGIPEETQVTDVNSMLELDLTKIEGEFLQGILQEEAELNWVDEGVQESEWYLFLENLLPVTPKHHANLEECEKSKEQRLRFGDTSLREWDVLLDRLSHMEATVVQQILGHIESDVLEEILDYLHSRMIQESVQEREWEKSLPLPSSREVPSKTPHNKPVQDKAENAAMHSFQESGLHRQMDTRSMTNPLFEQSYGTMDWLCWPQEGILQYTKLRCYFLKESDEQVSSILLGNSLEQGESKLEGTFQGFQQHQVLHGLLPKSSNNDKPDHEDIFGKMLQKMDLNSELTLQQFKQQQMPQKFLSRLFSQGELCQKEIYGEMQQQRESEARSEPKPSNNEWLTLNLDFRQRCSEQIESKLAEIPCQIASTLFLRTPQNIDSQVLHQLFRQIATIVFQVMPQQILFDSIQPELVEDHLFNHLHWHVDFSLQRQLNDSLEYTKLNLVKPHRWHHLQSLAIQQNLHQIHPQHECNNDSKQRELEQTLFEGNQHLDSHKVDNRGEQLQEDVQNYLFPLASMDFVHLVPQSLMGISFPKMDPIEAHTLCQKMCLLVLRQIAKQVKYNNRQGLLVEINLALLHALDLYHRHYWLQSLGEEARHDYIYHHPDESFEVLDVESNTSQGTSQLTETSTDSGELHEDMNSTTSLATKPNDVESLGYYMADPIFKVYHRHSSYNDVNVDNIRQYNPYENLHYQYGETPNQSVPKAMMPLYNSPLNILEDIKEYIEMVTLGNKLQDKSKEMEFNHFKSSLDHMGSLDLRWMTRDGPRHSQATEQPIGGKIGHQLDFHVNRLAVTATNMFMVPNPGESLKLGAAPQDQLEDTSIYHGNNFFVLKGLQNHDPLGSSTKQMVDSYEVDGSYFEEPDTNSQSSQSHGSRSSFVEAQYLQGKTHLNKLCCDCCQPQLPDSTKMKDSPICYQGLQAKQRNSERLNSQIASVSSFDGLEGSDSHPSSNSIQSEDASETSSQTEKILGINSGQSSEIHEESQENKIEGPNVLSPRDNIGKPWQSHTCSSNKEPMHQEASTSKSPKGCSSIVKFTKRSTSQSSPTLSQFNDPSTHVRHTIFGLLVLAGGLYLVENRDAIEQQSMSATEAASEAWRWLGNFLIRMARGEFDN